MLILLYNFIPNRIFIEKGRKFSILVGLIFSFAAVMGILVPWTGTSHLTIGYNGILIPLAGYVGGLFSAGITTILLLLFKLLFEGGIGSNPDLIATLLAVVVGSAIHEYQKQRPAISPVHTLLILSLIYAGISLLVLNLSPSGFGENWMLWGVRDAEMGYIIFIGLFLLGMIILQIDRKKGAECELIRYQGELETLVEERTAELAQINSLQQATLESTSDGIVVVDLQGKVIGFNRTAGIILDIRASAETREDSLDVLHLLKYHLADPEVVNRDFLAFNPADIQILTSELLFRSGRSYGFSITPYLLNGEMLGQVLTFRDITEKKQAEEILKGMNQKLLMLSGITRHDILNQIAALNLYLYLVRSDPTDPQTSEYLDRMGHMLHRMQQHARDSGDYQNVGIHEPVWHLPDMVFDRATASFADQGIIFSAGVFSYEILADPLIERVIYNLIDNSLRHGEYVTRIILSSIREGDHLLIIYEDNGCGVNPDEKDQIFQKGFGKHTGFGMFLVQEILSITGISICENGIPGSGARFEMKVPEGIFRDYQPGVPDKNDLTR